VPGIATSGSTDVDELNAHAVPVLNPGDQATTATMAAAPVTAAMLAVAGSAAASYTAAGPVSLDLGGKCLTDGGDSSVIGHPVQTWPCNGRGYESWQVANGTIQIHGRCLAAAGTVSQSKVVLAACGTDGSQQWRVGTGAELVNLASGACLDDPRSSVANGVALWIYACNGTASQKWTLPAGPVLSQVAGQCLDNRDGSLADGNKVEIWPCNGYGAQKWALRPDGTVRTGGRCLDVYQSGTAAGSVVDLWSCDGSAAQQWTVLAGGSAVRLENPESGECLTDPADAAVDGTGLVLGSCTATGPGTAWLVR
jgi:beta-glucosidase